MGTLICGQSQAILQHGYISLHQDLPIYTQTFIYAICDDMVFVTPKV